MSEYLGNLKCPDLRSNFRHIHFKPHDYSFGRDVPSDWSDKADDDPIYGLYKRCGMWCREEAAVLYQAANEQRSSGDIRHPRWLDIGAHTGWTSAHISQAGCNLIAVEPMLWNQDWYDRFSDNLRVELEHGFVMPWAGRSEQFFQVVSGNPEPMFDGIVIDGDHMQVAVARDVMGARNRIKPNGVILVHDFIGAWKPAVALLSGFKCRVYLTPHVVGCFWSGDWMPPDHVPDPSIDWDQIKTNHMKGFPWDRCV